MFFTLTKCKTCNTIHHKKCHYFLIVKKKMYRKMSSVHGSSVLTVIKISSKHFCIVWDFANFLRLCVIVRV